MEKLVRTCQSCQLVTDQTEKAPLQPSELPSAPWKQVAVDICGPFPNGKYLLVVMDEYSRFPEVEMLKQVGAEDVMMKLDKIFSS